MKSVEPPHYYVCDRCGHLWRQPRGPKECHRCGHAALWEFSRPEPAREHAATIEAMPSPLKNQSEGGRNVQEQDTLSRRGRA
jgi:hypothetical protein